MLTEAQKQFFEDNGCLVLDNVLPPDLLAELQSAARALADADPAETNRVWHERALFRRPAFRPGCGLCVQQDAFDQHGAISPGHD